MNIKKKIALAAIPAVMALSATDASSKVLLMSDNGWEVSFDGAANAFYNHTSTGNMDTLGVQPIYTLVKHHLVLYVWCKVTNVLMELPKPRIRCFFNFSWSITKCLGFYC